MKGYLLTQEAEDDLIRIYLYGHGKFGERQAEKYYRSLIEHFERIAVNPYLFPAADHIGAGYRYCVCGSDTIYYKVTATNEIVIITIIGRQDFEKKLRQG